MRTITLGIVWLFLCPSVDAMSLKGQNVDQQEGKAEVREETLPKRVKRGWMWNQFSVMEEYTGTDYQYIGRVSAVPLSPSCYLNKRKAI